MSNMVSPKTTHRYITTSQGRLYIAETGKEHPDCLVFLHGWPEDWTAWQTVLTLAGETHHAVAFNLPGIGKSSAVAQSGEKAVIADILHEAIQQLGCNNYIVIGHDIGAMVAFAYLRKFSHELSGAVLLGAAVPGIAPWEAVVQNPYIWHFAFHAVPKLPEKLVSGNQRVYFDYFFDALAHHPANMGTAARERYAAAYGSSTALSTGFNWYRAFTQDASTNEVAVKIDTPLLYLRGEFDAGDMNEYVDGLHKAGVVNVAASHVAKSKHFIAEENPAGLWKEIAAFASKVVA